MSRERGLEKHFEAILGRELVGPETGVVVVRTRVGLFTREEGHTTSREIGTTGTSTKSCSPAHVIDIDGIAQTDKTGKVQFSLSDFHCFSDHDNAVELQHPFTILLTPRTSAPVFATVTAERRNQGTDVTITIATWDANGAPAPHVLVNWRCRSAYILHPIID